MWFLGMDVGTGGTRAVVVDAAGKLMGTASSAHAPFRAEHPGWAEQDPEDWWRAAQEAIRSALAATPEPNEPIAAIALTGQMHGAVMLDENGAVLRPSLIWCDTRTQPECDWLTERIGYDRLIELTCNPALPNFTLTKLLWVKKHEPETFTKIAHVMCPKDYVRYRKTQGYNWVNIIAAFPNCGPTVPARRTKTISCSTSKKAARNHKFAARTSTPPIAPSGSTPATAPGAMPAADTFAPARSASSPSPTSPATSTGAST